MPSPRSLAVACSLAFALACQPRGSAVQPGGEKPAGGGTTGGGGDYAPLAPVTRAAEVLPASTLVVLDVAGPTRLAEIVGRDALVAKFPAEYKEIATDMQREIGRDLLDPKQLSAIGVDAGGRMGLALLGIEPFAGAAWFTLSDAAKFRAFAFDVIAKKGDQPKSMPLGGAEIVTLREGREWLVIRAPLAFIVVRDSGESRDDPALAIASADPNRALANDKDFRRAAGRLAPADAMVFVDGGELWRTVEEQIAAKEAARSEPTSNWAREEAAAARSRGEKPERIAELEAQAKDIDESQKRWERREQAQRELVKKLFGGVGTGVWSFSAKPGGIVGDGRIELGADALALKILRNHSGPQALPRALDDRPLWMMTGAIEVEQAIGFLDLAMQTEGMSWQEAVAEAKRETGIDLDGELRPLFTGDMGLAITMDGDLSAGDPDKALQKIGFGAEVKLTDPAKAQAVLDKLGTKALAEMKKKKRAKDSDDPILRKDGKGWVLDFPKWRKVSVAVTGDRLVASTDPGLGKRIASGDTGKGAKLAPSAAMVAAGWEQAAFGAMVDLELSMWMMMGRSMAFDTATMIESPEDAKVPKSKAWKAKQKQIDAATAKIRKAEAKRNADQLARFRAVTQPWGAIAGNLQEDGNAIIGTGGLFVRSKGGVAGALMESLTAVKALTESERSDDTLMKLFEERTKLEQEQREIRARDIAKKRGTGSAAVPAVPVEAPPPR